MVHDFSEACPLQSVSFKHKPFIVEDISKEFRRGNYHQTRRQWLEGGTRKHI